MVGVRVNFVYRVLAFWMLLGSMPTWAQYAGGTGTADDPYRIANAEQLISMGNDFDAMDKHFVLVADIDLDPDLPGGQVFDRAPLDWPVRRGLTLTRIPFSGVFDGAGHVIRNLVIDGEGSGTSIHRRRETSITGPEGQERERYMYVSYREQGFAGSGLFAEIGGSGCVRNLGLENVNMPCVIDYAGCLAGSSQGSITNCYATGHVNSYGEYVGGLIGFNHENGRVIGCYSDVEVKGLRYVGGLVGYHRGNIISNCSAAGRVVNQSVDPSTRWPEQAWHVGGLVGHVDQDAAVIHCAAHGTVTGGEGSWRLGGLVGFDAGGLILNCYATADVTGGDLVDALGGLVGEASEGTTVATCYSTSQLRAGADSRSLGGLIGWSEMRSARACYFLAQDDGGGPHNGVGVPLPNHAIEDPDSFVGWDIGSSDIDGPLRPWVMSPDRGPELSVLCDTTLSPLQGGGTLSDPFRIRSGSDLTWVALHPHAAYRLEADLDLSGRTWNQAVVPCLGGVLDGNGHTVRHIDIASHGCAGLFCILGHRAVVTRLNLVDGDIQVDDAGSRIGMLAGINAGTLVACTVSDARVRGGHDNHALGGLVGKNVAGTISSCTADTMVGGRKCSYIGGLVGQHARGAIRNCLAQGTVISGTSSQHVGGLVGGSTDMIMGCLSLAAVSNDSTRSSHGGLLGSGYWVEHSYYLSAHDGGGPNQGKGSPLTSEQMRKRESFAGWDFTGSSADGTVNAWALPAAESYPCPSVLCGFPPPVLPGSGSSTDPFKIESAQELGAVYYRPDGHYRLVANVDCSGIRWAGAVIPYFTGVLDGGGHSLVGMQMTGQRLVGLCGVIAPQGRVSNLKFEHVDITLEDNCMNVGSAAGCSKGWVQDCHGLHTGSIHGGDFNLHIGGLVGQNEGVIRRCSSLLPIQMTYRGYRVGGLVGKILTSGLLSECWADCEIVCGENSDYLGGLVGGHDGRIIVNCYAFGSIVAGAESEFLGGLAGENGPSLITTSYAAGSVTAAGGGDMGGLVGYNLSWNERYVEDCYFLAPGDGGGPDNGLGTPLTQTQMHRQESFVGWDFVDETQNGNGDFWIMSEQLGFPLLAWERTAGPGTPPDGGGDPVNIEGFESGDFTRLPWQHSGETSWSITSEERYSGRLSAQSSVVSGDQSTSLYVTLPCVDGQISFWRKVSCHNTVAKFTFHIDDKLMDKWSGSLEWVQVSYPVTEGTHTFTWTYSKLGWSSFGEGTAWIDEVAFPLE